MAPRQECGDYGEYLRQLALRAREEAERREEEFQRLFDIVYEALQEQEVHPALPEPEVAQEDEDEDAEGDDVIERDENEDANGDGVIEIDVAFLQDLFNQFLEEFNAPLA